VASASRPALGLFGGTFDPPHFGHLVVAQEAAELLGLERVWFLPAGQPPHKRGQVISPLADRLRMVELAIGDNSRFELSRDDCERAEPSFTVDLLRRLRAKLGRTTELFFLVGMDSLLELQTWREPERVLELCTLVAVTRPGHPAPDLAAVEAQLAGSSRRIRLLETPGVDVSSTDLRARVAAGRPIRYLVPDAVRHYITAAGLYLSAS
jgi:nicotinate-nucleotide adenylyltransferase